MLTLPKSATVVEVSPRDGLQSFSRPVTTDDKVKMIDRLSAAGFKIIEATSFASPRAVPLLADGEEVMSRITRRPGVQYRALAPNMRGAERAVAAKVDSILGLITASATYLRKNQNMTLDQAVEQGGGAFRVADKGGLDFVMAIGMSFWCAYEGTIPTTLVLDLITRFRNHGISQFYLAGSVGMEDPVQVNTLFRRVTDQWPDCKFDFHAHNLSGMATANILAALDGGARRIEGGICGIGGGIALPSALGAVGNLPSEDIVRMLNDMGVDTGLDSEAVKDCARDIAELLAVSPQSHVGRYGTRADIMAGAARCL